MKYYIGKVPFGKDDENSLAHYGRKGMQWNKHLFGIDLGNALNMVKNTAKGAGKAVGNVANGAANYVGNTARQVSGHVGRAINNAGKATGNFVGNYVTGSIPKAEAERQRRIGDIHLKNAVNANNNSRKTLMRSMDNRNDGRTIMELRGRSNESNNYADSRANQAREAYEKSARAERQYNRAFIPALKNELSGYASAGKAVGNAIGGAANAAGNWVGERARDIGSLAGQAGQAVGNVANGAGQWLGDRARDVGNFVDQNITGNSAREEAGKHYSYANNHNDAATEQHNRYKDLWSEAQAAQGPEKKDLLDQAGQAYSNAVRSIHNRDQEESQAEAARRRADNTLFGRVGNLANNIGNAVGQAGQAVGNAVGSAGNAVGTFVGDRVYDINNLAGQAGNWLGERANDVGYAVGQAGNAVGNVANDVGRAVGGAGEWLGDRAKDIGNFVNTSVTGNYFRDQANRVRESDDPRRYEVANQLDAIADRSLVGRIGNAVGQAGQAVGNTVGGAINNVGDFVGTNITGSKYHDMANGFRSSTDPRSWEIADQLDAIGDQSLVGRVGNAVGQAGQAVGQTMSNIGDWGGEQFDRGKKILGRIFGRR